MPNLRREANADRFMPHGLIPPYLSWPYQLVLGADHTRVNGPWGMKRFGFG